MIALLALAQGTREQPRVLAYLLRDQHHALLAVAVVGDTDAHRRHRPVAVVIDRGCHTVDASARLGFVVGDTLAADGREPRLQRSELRDGVWRKRDQLVPRVVRSISASLMAASSSLPTAVAWAGMRLPTRATSCTEWCEPCWRPR